MARSRFAGVSLDRQGNPVSPQAAMRALPVMHMSGREVVKGPGVEPVPDLGPVAWYEADRASIRRDLDPWELLALIDMWLLNKNAEQFAVRCSLEAYQRLAGDLRRHFRPRHKTPSTTG